MKIHWKNSTNPHMNIYRKVACFLSRFLRFCYCVIFIDLEKVAQLSDASRAKPRKHLFRIFAGSGASSQTFFLTMVSFSALAYTLGGLAFGATAVLLLIRYLSYTP